MTVEMNPPSVRNRPKKASQTRVDEGAQKLDKSQKRLSEDVYSLNSWSENLSLSTSSSSESGSRHGSLPRSKGRLQEEKSKVKTTHCKESAKHSGFVHGHEHNGAPFDPTKQNEKWPLMNVVGHHSAGARSSVNSGQRDYEVDSSLVTGLSLGNYDYQYDPPMSDPDFYNFNKYGYDHESLPEPYPVHKTSSSVVNDSVGKGNVSSIHGNASESVTPKPKNIYPDLNYMMKQDSNCGVLTTSSSLTSSGINVISAPSTSQAPTQRPRFFDKSRKPHHKKLEHSKSQPKALYERPFSSLPSQSSQCEELEISSECLSQYNPRKTEQASRQGSAGLSGRLHKSQPNIGHTPQLKRQPKSSSDLESLKQSFEHRLEPENVKTAVKSIWNNLKYGWRFQSKPSIKYDSPLFMLGKCYHRRKEGPDSEPEGDFLKDFASRIWLTYRSKFYPIPGTKLSTDCGWGCMLRSGQMLIAQCLVTHYLGRDWRLYDKQSETQTTFYREIIRWFSDPIDTPSDKTPFCLHHLANFGRTYNKDPGEWYGPASVAYIFRDAFTRARQTLPILSQLCIYVAQDCTVYKDDVVRLCTERESSESMSRSTDGQDQPQAAGATAAPGVQHKQWLRSIIILIPMRLGGEVMNEIYIPCVKNLLSHDSCMGIIGGKPKHSLYFLGWQDDKLIYLDPHLCRDAVDTSVNDFRIETYHCMTPRKLTISKMDPSCTVGFYIKNEVEFEKFVKEITEYVSPPKQRATYPLFIFSEGSHDESSTRHSNPTTDRRVKVTHYHFDANGQRQRTFSKESEDFVML